MRQNDDNPTLKTVAAALRHNRFDVHLVSTGAQAREKVLEIVPVGAVVGAGDSTTLREIRIWETLEARGTRVINPFTKELTLDPAQADLRRVALRDSLGQDVYLCSVNAVTLDGKLVSTDRVGNRVAGMVFGAPKVIVVVGRNKIVPDVEVALKRIKDVIAPAHARWKGRRTPCATTGVCTDCSSLDRICGITIIVEKRPHLTALSVVLVDEDLGLGWDPSWPTQRTAAIRGSYEEHTWAFTAQDGVGGLPTN